MAFRKYTLVRTCREVIAVEIDDDIREELSDDEIIECLTNDFDIGSRHGWRADGQDADGAMWFELARASLPVERRYTLEDFTDAGIFLPDESEGDDD